MKVIKQELFPFIHFCVIIKHELKKISSRKLFLSVSFGTHHIDISARHQILSQYTQETRIFHLPPSTFPETVKASERA